MQSTRGASPGPRPARLTATRRRRSSGGPRSFWRLRPELAQPSELHLRWRLGGVGGRVLGHRLVRTENRRSPDRRWKRPEVRVVHAYRVDVVAPSHGDAVLGALKL